MIDARGKGRRNLLEGSVYKSLFMIALPIIFGNILQTVYQLIDTFWVGRLGASAVAAVSLSFPILFFLTSLAMGFTMAGTILVSQYNGRGDHERVDLATSQTLALVMFMTVVISAVGYLSSNSILSLMTQDSTVLSDATLYLQILFLSLGGMFIFVIFQGALTGVGEVKLPMAVVFSTVVLNFFLDPILMLGYGPIPAMGVAGVAWATLITQYLSAVIGIIVLLGGKYGVKVRFSELLPRMEYVKTLVRLGVPASIEMSSRSFSMMLVTFVVSVHGTLVVAAYGIGIRILSFIIIPAIGFSFATTALIGNNLGAKQEKRAQEISAAGMKISFMTLTILGVFLFFTAYNVSEFLVPNEPELIAKSTLFIKFMALTFGLIGIQTVIIGTFKGAGMTTTSMFLAIFHSICIISLSYVLSINSGFGEIGIWMAYPLANLLACTVAFYFYNQKRWMKRQLT